MPGIVLTVYYNLVGVECLGIFLGSINSLKLVQLLSFVAENRKDQAPLQIHHVSFCQYEKLSCSFPRLPHGFTFGEDTKA